MNLKEYINKSCKIKVFAENGKLKGTKIGTIAITTDNFIVVQLKNYKESYSYNLILSDSQVELSVKLNNEWIGLRGLILQQINRSI